MIGEVQAQNLQNNLARDPGTGAISVQRQSAGKIPSSSGDVSLFKIKAFKLLEEACPRYGSNLLYSVSTDLNVKHIQRTFRETSRMFDEMPGHRGSTNLTHKINQL